MNNKSYYFIVVFILCNITGCDVKDKLTFSGYSYGDFIYLSYISTEKVEEIYVKKGQSVDKNQPLVKMDRFTVRNALDIAEKDYLAEQALLTDLLSGERPAELNIIRAQLDRARSAASLAKDQLSRYQKLYNTKVISAEEWQKSRDDVRQKNASVSELEHQLEARQLPARQSQVNNQQLRVESAKLRRDKALRDWQQNILVAPEAGIVYDTLYLPGERPVAGRPIISLLPAGNIKIRFYVPEKQLGLIRTGMAVSLRCDGCSGAFRGTLSYISPQAEYTPPVIYSTSRREKLIFMAEAIPEPLKAGDIKTGQPFQVEVLAGE